jgi:hypothetical protein
MGKHYSSDYGWWAAIVSIIATMIALVVSILL